MEIIKAKVGSCYGIIRAYHLMNKKAARDNEHFYVTHQNSSSELDPLKRIERREGRLMEIYPALEKVSVAHDIAELCKDDRLVLGFHGLPYHAKKQLEEKGVNILDDLQCPFIARLNHALESLVSEGFDIIIVGKRQNHHCQEALKLAERYNQRCFVIEKDEDVETIICDSTQRLALVGQVTGNIMTFNYVVKRLHQKGIPVKVEKTVCSDSYLRQGEAIALAKESDVVVIVDDGGGASQSVFEVCSTLSKRIYRIRRKEEITQEWFGDAHKVAIVGGILVPEWSIDEVAEYIEEICAK